MKRLIAASLGALALVATSPAFARDEGAVSEGGEVASEPQNAEDAIKLFGAMFAAEPLTEEQQARLPLATRLVEKIMPEGALEEMMAPMFDGLVKPLMAMGKPSAKSAAARLLGVQAIELDLNEDEAAQIAAMIDPAWEERERRQMEMMPKLTARLFAAMEPAMRRAMAEVYAVHFTQTELEDIAAFFDTPSGASYARKSYQLASDPRLMSATIEALPQSMETLKGLKEEFEQANADLPKRRGFAELSAEERARLAEVTGLSEEELSQKIAEAAKKNAFDF